MFIKNLRPWPLGEYVVIVFLIVTACHTVWGLQSCCPCGNPAPIVTTSSASGCVVDSVTYSTCNFTTWSSWDCSACSSQCGPTPGTAGTAGPAGPAGPRAVRRRSLCCDPTLQAEPGKCFQACHYALGADNIEYSDCTSTCGSAPPRHTATQRHTTRAGPVQCREQWSQWINTDTPDTGDGDTESWSGEQKASFCAAGGRITSIACKTTTDILHYNTGEIVAYTSTSTPSNGPPTAAITTTAAASTTTTTATATPKTLANFQTSLPASEPSTAVTAASTTVAARTTHSTLENTPSPAADHAHTELSLDFMVGGKVVSVCLFVLGLIIGSVSTCLVRWLVARKHSRSGSVSPGSVGMTSKQDGLDDTTYVHDEI